MRGGEGFLTENDLIKKCKKGSREAFNILVSNYQQQVINIAYGMLSNQEDAYDAAQELSLIHISEPTRRTPISYAVFCLKKKTTPSLLKISLFHRLY